MSYINYPNGSEWRKWDLQACTNKYYSYNGITLDEKELKKIQELTGLEKSQINSN